MALLLRRVRLSLACIHGTVSVLLVRYGVLFFLSSSRVCFNFLSFSQACWLCKSELAGLVSGFG